jgi:glycosyltransferase involved in cell wall biosynthesis
MNEAAKGALRVLEIETYGRGGLMHYAFNLSDALARRGATVDLVTAAGCELADRPVPDGLRLSMPLGRWDARNGGRWPRPLASLGRKSEALLDARTVARIARRLAPDIVHLHNTNTSALAYLSALRRLRLPLVATAHVVTPHEPVAFQEALYRRIHTLPDLVIAHSELDRARLVREFGVPEGNITVIPHGDYSFFAELGETPDRTTARQRLGIDGEAPVVLFFGYLREYKGLDVLLDAWPSVTATTPGARLVIVGDPVRLPPARREEFERRADAVGALRRFEYVPLEEVAGYFAAADLLVLPYRRISQSGVLYLALSLGVPVVASAVGAWPDLLTNGEQALLVEPGSPSALADALVRALRDPGLRERLAAGGGAVARAHAWPAVAERTEQAFRALLARLAADQLQ